MLSIAIDGPAGVGKSNITTMLSKKLGWGYLDTGALYRASTIYLLKQNVDLNNINEVIEKSKNMKITISYVDGLQHTFLNNEDVTDLLRKAFVSDNVAKVSQIPQIREIIKKLQRDIASQNNIIIEGRDIGTEILPNSLNKFYLDASPHIRAIRRAKQIMEQTNKKMTKSEIEDLENQMKIRDEMDKTRKISPLKQAPDAIYIDTSNLTQEEVLNTICSLLILDKNKKKLKKTKLNNNTLTL